MDNGATGGAVCHTHTPAHSSVIHKSNHASSERIRHHHSTLPNGAATENKAIDTVNLECHTEASYNSQRGEVAPCQRTGAVVQEGHAMARYSDPLHHLRVHVQDRTAAVGAA